MAVSILSYIARFSPRGTHFTPLRTPRCIGLAGPMLLTISFNYNRKIHTLTTASFSCMSTTVLINHCKWHRCFKNYRPDHLALFDIIERQSSWSRVFKRTISQVTGPDTSPLIAVDMSSGCYFPLKLFLQLVSKLIPRQYNRCSPSFDSMIFSSIAINLRVY